jgi:hypothetical protein
MYGFCTYISSMRNPDATSRNSRKNRDDRLELRLEDAEKQAFRDAADLAGLPLSAWVRERLRHAARSELQEFGRPVGFLDGVVGKSGKQSDPGAD